MSFRFCVGDNVEGVDCGGFHGIGIVKNRHTERQGPNRRSRHNVYDVVYYDAVRGKVVEEPFLEASLSPPKYRAPDNHWLHEWDDETSQFDPKGCWQYGSEYFKRTFKIWVPDSIRDDQDAIDEYVESQQGIPDKWAD